MNIIELLRYIVYGLVQGIFEVFPISSSGQVAFIQYVIDDGFQYSQFFLIIVNLGSLVAIIVFFRKMLKELLCQSYRDVIKKDHSPENLKATSYIKNIIVAIIPIGIIGSLITLSDFQLESFSLIIIGVGSLLTATIMFLSRNRTNQYTSTKLTRPKAWYIGLFQLFALIPGVSRLGVTAVAGTHQELSYNTALNFSIIMSIPISIGAVLISLLKGLTDVKTFIDFDITNFYMYIYYFISVAVSFLGTFYALKFIFVITQKGNFRMFYIYNLAFGLVALIIGLANY